MKPTQVVAIDLSKRELEEAPAGPLKIVMDATDLKFLDASFPTATAFFSLMYMCPEIQQRLFAEVPRVLAPGAMDHLGPSHPACTGGRYTRPGLPVPFPTARQGGPDRLRHFLA